MERVTIVVRYGRNQSGVITVINYERYAQRSYIFN